MTDFRALCAELLQELEHATDWDYQKALKDQTRAALAQPEPDDPSPFLAWILFDCDGKLRLEAQKVLAARGVIQPKPPNLKEEALLKLKELQALLQFENVDSSCIRRALESIPDPS